MQNFAPMKLLKGCLILVIIAILLLVLLYLAAPLIVAYLG